MIDPKLSQCKKCGRVYPLLAKISSGFFVCCPCTWRAVGPARKTSRDAILEWNEAQR